MIPASGTYQNRQETACFPSCSGWIRCLFNCIRPEITPDRGSSIPDGFRRTRERLKPARILRRKKPDPYRIPTEPYRYNSGNAFILAAKSPEPLGTHSGSREYQCTLDTCDSMLLKDNTSSS